MWLCRCECGGERVVRVQRLTSGEAQSCGCAGDKPHGSYARHGKTRTREYNIWVGMKQRCTNPANPRYAEWGGRGIQICERWLNSFENFLADMGPCPERFSIDRINNNGNYEPPNCRWASGSEQQLNNRGTRKETAFGKTLSLVEWAREIGVDPSTISRALRRGESVGAVAARAGYTCS